MWIGFSVTSLPWIGRCPLASCIATHHHCALPSDRHKQRTETWNLLGPDFSVRWFGLG